MWNPLLKTILPGRPGRNKYDQIINEDPNVIFLETKSKRCSFFHSHSSQQITPPSCNDLNQSLEHLFVTTARLTIRQTRQITRKRGLWRSQMREKGLKRLKKGFTKHQMKG